MGYIHSVKNRVDLRTEYTRFFVKLFSGVLISLLILFLGFEFTFTTLIAVFGIAVLFYAIFGRVDNSITRFFSRLEREYDRGFAGKTVLLTILSFITTLIVFLVLLRFVYFPIEWAVIIGFLIFGVSNNLASLVLYHKENQHHVHGTTLEYFFLSTLLGLLLMYGILSLPFFYSLYIAIGVNLFLIIPEVDHNLTVPLVSGILYILLFI